MSMYSKHLVELYTLAEIPMPTFWSQEAVDQEDRMLEVGVGQGK